MCCIAEAWQQLAIVANAIIYIDQSASLILTTMSNKRPIEFELWTWKRSHSRWDKKVKCLHAFPCFSFLPFSAAEGGFICFLWCFVKELIKILQVSPRQNFFFHILFLFCLSSCLKQQALSPWKNLDKQPYVLFCQPTDGLVTGTLAWAASSAECQQHFHTNEWSPALTVLFC